MHFIEKPKKGQKNQNLQRSISSKMEWIETTPDPTTQSNKVWKKNNLSSGRWRSESSKSRAFRSRHKHQSTQWGIIFQTKAWSWWPNCPNQQEKKSSTDLGITHWTPNKPKTKDQRSAAIEQWRKRWSTLSPSLRHIQHQFGMMKPRFCRLSNVRAFPREESDAGRDLSLPSNLPRKHYWIMRG